MGPGINVGETGGELAPRYGRMIQGRSLIKTKGLFLWVIISNQAGDIMMCQTVSSTPSLILLTIYHTLQTLFSLVSVPTEFFVMRSRSLCLENKSVVVDSYIRYPNF